MHLKKIFIILFVLLSLCSHAQTGAPAYQKFYTKFLDSYKELSKPPIKNIYNVLSNSAKFSFSGFDTVYINALSELSRDLGIDEPSAVDSLFSRTFANLRASDLWVSNMDIYKTKKKLFSIYYHSLCPCISQKMKKTDRMEKLLGSVQDCTYNLIKDSSFIDQLRVEAGDNTMNELFLLQQHLTLFIYQQCDIIHSKFNETIFNYPVYDDYITDITFLKRRNGEDLLRYFKNNQVDSVSLIFPGYKKYIKTLNQVSARLKEKDVSLSSYYSLNRDRADPKIVVTVSRGRSILGEIIMATTPVLHKTLISSISYEVFKPSKKINEDMIIEIKEDPVKPVEKIKN